MVQTRTIIKNPILRGFNPDPCVLRVGDTYYIAVSSFEWLPGVRVYQSQDLANWDHLTDILTDQVDLRGNPQNGSIWAPQISYSDGLFYLIYTNVKSTKRPFKDSHNYLISAPSLTGPWSAPVYLNSSGFDPSLFHDDDGRKWLLNEIWDYRLTTGNKSAGIVLQEYDAERQELVGPVYKIFDGTELAKTEAPHVYKHNGYYYLLTAEGGTSQGHAVTVCRAREITGPYELDPEYPLLTASDKPESPLQCSGHASLFQAQSGKWYITYLTTRPLQGHAILGRETALQEVIWSEDGWLRLADGSTGPAQYVELDMETPVVQLKDTDFRDDFAGPLGKEWNTLRILADPSWVDFASRPGWLRLRAGESPQSLFDHHLLAIRQKDFRFTAGTRLASSPQTYNQMAGLLLYLNDSNYLYLYLTFQEGMGKVLRLARCEKDDFTLRDVLIPMTTDEVELRVEADGGQAAFYWRDSAEEDWGLVGEEDLLFLSGGFTGNFIGIGVHDMDTMGGSYADFDYFHYEGHDD